MKLQSEEWKAESDGKIGDRRLVKSVFCSSQASRNASGFLRLAPSTQSLTSSGFTLLEIMVALAILSLGIVTVLELLAGSLNIGVKASRHTQASIYAQNIMDRAFAQAILDDGEERGEFPDGYSWVARVREIHPEDNGSRFQSNQPNQLDFFHLKEIEVQIAWDENGGGKTFVVRSLRAQSEQPSAQNVPN